LALKIYKPLTPGQRFKTGETFEEVTKSKPEKALQYPLRGTAGRNNRGKVTVRHHGGGVKKMGRRVDFKRDKPGVPGRVAAIEYDPNRSARLALIHYADGDKRYILAPSALKVGDTVVAGPEAEIRPGNALPLKSIPVGTQVHNVELYSGKGAQLVRSAGNSAQILAREGEGVLLRLPSGEIRRFNGNNYCTIGQLGNGDHKNVILGKAGRKRLMGWRPHVRGVAMTPRDHPHGGGEGRSPIGMPGPKSPWGKPTLGYKTRGKKKTSDRFIVRRRP